MAANTEIARASGIWYRTYVITYHPNTSNVSSYPNLLFNLIALKQTGETTAPINNAAIGPTYPDAGVMATKPATAPLAQE